MALGITLYPIISSRYNEKHQSEIHVSYQEQMEQVDTSAIDEARDLAIQYREYFPNVIVSTTKGMLDSFENRMANILFKNTVELSMVLHALAATHNISDETLRELRRMCIDDVKKINGTISLSDAVKFQKG